MRDVECGMPDGVGRWDDIAGQHRNYVRASESRVKVPTLACFHFASGWLWERHITLGHGANKRRGLGLIGLPSPCGGGQASGWTSFWDDKYGNFPWAVVKSQVPVAGSWPGRGFLLVRYVPVECRYLSQSRPAAATHTPGAAKFQRFMGPGGPCSPAPATRLGPKLQAMWPLTEQGTGRRIPAKDSMRKLDQGPGALIPIPNP